MSLRLLPARPDDDDARLVLRWRNDAVTRAASFHQAPKQWPAFRDEYLGYFEAPLPPLFGALGEERVGFVRFRRVEDPERPGGAAVDISINVAPEVRGRGVGKALIAAATDAALAVHDVILAEIRPGNRASVGAFLAAGYRRIDDGTHDVDGEPVAVERYLRRREERRPQPAVGLRALLLDLDGTLIDSDSALRAAFHRFLERHGVTPGPGEYDRWNGPPLAEIVAGLAAAHRIAGDRAALFDEYVGLLEDDYVRRAPLAPGAPALLDSAAKAGLAAAVITSGPTRLAQPLLDRLGVRPRLGAFVCGDEVARGKPAPDGYAEALRRLGVPAGAALAVEDTATGVRAAVGAGLRCIGVGPQGGVRLLRAGARVCATNLDEVRAIVEGRLVGPGRVMAARRFAVRVRCEPEPLDAETEARVDSAWEAARAARPSLVDGEILSVEGFRGDGDTIVVEAVRDRYRRFVAQRAGVPLGIRPLGVSGITVVVGDGVRQLVLGRRAPMVTQYPRCWELIPSGGVSARRVGTDGTVDVEGQLLEELQEELGVAPSRVRALAPLGLIEDLDDQVIDLCFRLEVETPIEPLAPHVAAAGEYDRLALLALDEVMKRISIEPFMARFAATGPGAEPADGIVPTVEPLVRLLAAAAAR